MSEQNPWQKKPDGPPDLMQLISKFFKQKQSGSEQSDGEGGSFSMSWLWGLVGVIFLIWVISGIYIVNQAEEAVILRFGRYVRTVGPGPHWLPTFIESETKVDIQQIRNFQYQSEMLTQDENIVNVSLAVQYRVDNTRDYLFNVVNPEQTLQQSAASALRQIVGQMTLDSILTTGRASLTQRVATQLRQTLKAYDMGILVTDVRLLPAKPPEAVTEAFDDAIKAREDEQSYINQGEAYARKVISEVQGQTAKLMQSAEAYQQEVVLRATGNVARYDALLKPYVASPKVTHDRLYLDAMQSILSRTRNVIVDSGTHNFIYLPLDKSKRDKQSTAFSDQDDKGPAHLPPSSISAASSKVDPLKSTTLTAALGSAMTQQYGAPRPSYSTPHTSEGASS